MAGITAVIGNHTREGNRSWFRCSDGKLLEPLDILLLLFPNDGGEGVGDNVCFIPRHFPFSSLTSLLPPPSNLFSPGDLLDSLACLFVLCVLTTIGMLIFKLAWETFDHQFASITPSHKKWYVVANLTKAFYLAVLAFSNRYWIGAFRGFFYDTFQMTELKRCGIIYITADTVALFMVSKLPRSTQLHHIATNILCLLIAGTNMSTKGWNGLLGVSKMSLLYGIFSSVSFPVNAYLALRVVYSKSRRLPALVKLSLWTYLACCAGNWTVHVLWLAGLAYNLHFSFYTALYLVPVALMVNDDIVLIKWLVKKGSPFGQERHVT